MKTLVVSTCRWAAYNVWQDDKANMPAGLTLSARRPTLYVRMTDFRQHNLTSMDVRLCWPLNQPLRQQTKNNLSGPYYPCNTICHDFVKGLYYVSRITTKHHIL